MIVRALRNRAGVTQSVLAERAGTSQPAIAAYEAGRTSPTLRTLRRLAASVGHEVHVAFVAVDELPTREARRSLALHRRIVARLQDAPGAVLERAGRNLARMTARHPDAHALLDRWAELLHGPVEDLVEAMLDPGEEGVELRQATPFAGVLSARERAGVYRRFAEGENGG